VPLGTVVDLGPGHIVLDGNPAPARKGHGTPPSFRPMYIVAKRSPSQLLLSTCSNLQRQPIHPTRFRLIWAIKRENQWTGLLCV